MEEAQNYFLSEKRKITSRRVYIFFVISILPLILFLLFYLFLPLLGFWAGWDAAGYGFVLFGLSMMLIFVFVPVSLIMTFSLRSKIYQLRDGLAEANKRQRFFLYMSLISNLIFLGFVLIYVLLSLIVEMRVVY